MKVAHVEGYSICVGINEQPGLYVYFPTLSQLNPQLLEYLNLYSDKELNKNPEEKPGFFGKNGRVKSIKLKGLPSEGIEFDEVEHNGKTFWVSKKYTVPTKTISSRNHNSNKRDKKLKKFNRIREDQFHFHYNTILIKKCPNVIHPNDIIHISSKWHGTSGISAYVLCHRPLNWKQKLAKWLTGYSFDDYDYIYASRTVIKNKYINKEVTKGYYNCDVWAEADKVLRPFLEKEMTVYYEIVGFYQLVNIFKRTTIMAVFLLKMKGTIKKELILRSISIA